MAVKSYSLPKGLYASGVFFLGFMTTIPLLVSPLIVRTMIDPRAEGIDPGFQRYAMGTIYLGYRLGMAVAWTHLLRGLISRMRKAGSISPSRWAT